MLQEENHSRDAIARAMAVPSEFLGEIPDYRHTIMSTGRQSGKSSFLKQWEEATRSSNNDRWRQEAFGAFEQQRALNGHDRLRNDEYGQANRNGDSFRSRDRIHRDEFKAWEEAVPRMMNRRQNEPSVSARENDAVAVFNALERASFFGNDLRVTDLSVNFDSIRGFQGVYGNDPAVINCLWHVRVDGPMTGSSGAEVIPGALDRIRGALRDFGIVCDLRARNIEQQMIHGFEERYELRITCELINPRPAPALGGPTSTYSPSQIPEINIESIQQQRMRLVEQGLLPPGAIDFELPPRGDIGDRLPGIIDRPTHLEPNDQTVSPEAQAEVSPKTPGDVVIELPQGRQARVMGIDFVPQVVSSRRERFS